MHTSCAIETVCACRPGRRTRLAHVWAALFGLALGLAYPSSAQAAEPKGGEDDVPFVVHAAPRLVSLKIRTGYEDAIAVAKVLLRSDEDKVRFAGAAFFSYAGIEAWPPGTGIVEVLSKCYANERSQLVKSALLGALYSAGRTDPKLKAILDDIVATEKDPQLVREAQQQLEFLELDRRRGDLDNGGEAVGYKGLYDGVKVDLKISRRDALAVVKELSKSRDAKVRSEALDVLQEAVVAMRRFKLKEEMRQALGFLVEWAQEEQNVRALAEVFLSVVAIEEETDYRNTLQLFPVMEKFRDEKVPDPFQVFAVGDSVREVTVGEMLDQVRKHIRENAEKTPND